MSDTCRTGIGSRSRSERVGMRTMMRGQFSGALIQQLDRLFQQGTVAGLSESELLERFARGHDESAFEAILARHGPMVLGVCRQLLRDPNDVDDAFQATFLVLVRKAGTLRRCDLLGNWLYGVAYRVATRARVLAARRTARAPYGQDTVDQLDTGAHGFAPGLNQTGNLDPEARPWLHEEVARLPEKYRVAVRLCYFEGLTHDEAAQRLGWPLGTVKGRLSRARDLLRKRLTRHGVTFSGPAAADYLSLPNARAAVPDSLEHATIQIAQAVARAAGASITSVPTVSLSVASLTEGVLQTMIMTHAKSVVVTLIVICAVTTGMVIGATQFAPSQPASDPPRQAALSPDEPNTSPQVQKVPSRSHAESKASPSSNEARKTEDSDSIESTDDASAPRRGTKDSMPTRLAMLEGAFGGGNAGDEAGVEFRHRLEIAQLSAALSTWEKNPKNDAIFKALDEPISMNFAKETALEFVLKFIKKRTAEKSGHPPIPIYVDPLGLQQAERSMNSTVIMDLEGVPLKTSLRLMLKQLGMAYCVRDGVLIISSVQGVREELAEAARELLGSGNEEVDMPLMQSMGIGPARSMGGMGGMMGGMGGGMRNVPAGGMM